MPKIRANGIEIDYGEIPAQGGATRKAPLVLLRGLGTQRIQWPDELLFGLASRGLRVMCPDNRDVGMTEKLDALGAPDMGELMAAVVGGKTPTPPYTLAEMAKDVVGLLDALEIEGAHVAGISMGGMIVQHLAADHADRFLSVTSVMSSSGAPGLPAATPEAMAALTSQPDDPTSRESVVSHRLATLKVIGSPGYPAPDGRAREMAERSYDRCYHPVGVMRQMAAVVCDAGRFEKLAKVTLPTLVLHGEADPLVPIACGRDTAERIAGARFESFPGMAHDVPVALAPRIAELIADHCEAAESA